MKTLHVNLALIALSLMLGACSASVDAGSPLAPSIPAQKPGSEQVLAQPVAGQISNREWQGRTALATIVKYSDGSEMLKIEIVADQLVSCAKNTSYGWTGLVEIFVPVAAGTYQGFGATVFIRGYGADGEVRSDDKTVVVERIDSQKVDLGIFAAAGVHKVNGKITARLCPSL